MSDAALAERRGSSASTRPSSFKRSAPRPQARLSVLHVAETWTGGVGVYLETLVSNQLDDPRVSEVHLVLSASRCPARVALEGHPRLSVHRYASSRSLWRIPRVSLAVRRIVRAAGPDVVHLHSTFAGVYGRILRLSCPVVYCAHGWAFTQDVGWLSRLAYGLTEAWLARRTDALIHISQDEQRAAHRFGVRARRSYVILHGVRAPRPSEPRALRLDPSHLNLAFIGRFDRQKGTDVLFRAFSSVARRDLRLFLLGDFDRDAATRREATWSDPRITHLGWIPQHEIDGYLARFDAVVIPSRWEGFGLVAAEAMRNGKAVIVSHRGGLPEQVVHGYNGLVFSFEQPLSLAQLLATLDKQTLAEMGENARRVWECSFSESRAYRALMEVYENALE